MPELKNTFTGGRMEKDLDERIVPSGLYREALNINVATSEDSEVGAAQNVSSNIKVTTAIQGDNGCYNCDNAGATTYSSVTPILPLEGFIDPSIALGIEDSIDQSIYNDSIEGGEACDFWMFGRYFGTNQHIASIADPQTDMIYRFIATTPRLMVEEQTDDHGVWMDRIVEYDTTKSLETPWYEKEKSVLVDIYKVRTKIVSVVIPDEYCNKSEITVCENSYQLREGDGYQSARERLSRKYIYRNYYLEWSYRYYYVKQKR